MDFIRWQVKHKNAIVFLNLRQLRLFGINAEFLPDKATDKMFLCGRNRIGLPKDPEIIHERDKHLIKDFAE